MKLVIVSMTFDPSSLASAYRALKLAKYLARAGCELELVSADSPDIHVTEINGNLLRIPYRPPLRGSSLAARLISRLLVLPEPQRAWVKPAVRGALARLRADLPDAVIVTSPPHSIQLVGVALAQELHVPYFADLRDDWITNEQLRWHTPLHRFAARMCEKTVVSFASGVFLPTEIIRSRFVERYPQWSHRIYTLTNGYDEDDFNAIDFDPARGLPDEKMILMYSGGDYGGFITSRLSILAKRMKEIGLQRAWHIVTAGPADWPPAQYRDVWTHLGLLSHQLSAQALLKANVLLLAFPLGVGAVSLKIYSYLRSGLPIVYIGECGAATDLLGRFDGTFVLERHWWPKLADWLDENGPIFLSNYPRPGIEEYSFHSLTGKLLEIIKWTRSAES